MRWAMAAGFLAVLLFPALAAAAPGEGDGPPATATAGDALSQDHAPDSGAQAAPMVPPRPEEPPRRPESAEPPQMPWLPDSLSELAAFAGQFLRVLAVLGAIVALGYLAMRVLGPRFAPIEGKSGDLIRVIEMKRLDPKTTLYLIEVAGQHALVAVSDREVRSLTPVSLDAERVRAALALRGEKAQARGASFAKILAETKSSGTAPCVKGENQ